MLLKMTCPLKKLCTRQEYNCNFLSFSKPFFLDLRIARLEMPLAQFSQLSRYDDAMEVPNRGIYHASLLISCALWLNLDTGNYIWAVTSWEIITCDEGSPWIKSKYWGFWVRIRHFYLRRVKGRGEFSPASGIPVFPRRPKSCTTSTENLMLMSFIFWKKSSCCFSGSVLLVESWEEWFVILEEFVFADLVHNYLQGKTSTLLAKTPFCHIITVTINVWRQWLKSEPHSNIIWVPPQPGLRDWALMTEFEWPNNILNYSLDHEQSTKD